MLNLSFSLRFQHKKNDKTALKLRFPSYLAPQSYIENRYLTVFEEKTHCRKANERRQSIYPKEAAMDLYGQICEHEQPRF